jgi:3D-(3,5/4)-trihydroxycyclohexane-1,2-dione acylhydrolase (decyclizing)
LSRSLGTDGFGTQYRFRKDGSIGLDGEASPGATLPVDLVANAQSLGAHALRVRSVDDLTRALRDTKKVDRTVVIVIEVDRYAAVPSYESWWDVPVAGVSTLSGVQQARRAYEDARKRERPLI